MEARRAPRTRAAGHRHIAMIEKKILRVICVELRHYCGLPTAARRGCFL
jgi:hypothetical protein